MNFAGVLVGVVVGSPKTLLLWGMEGGRGGGGAGGFRVPM